MARPKSATERHPVASQTRSGSARGGPSAVQAVAVSRMAAMIVSRGRGTSGLPFDMGWFGRRRGGGASSRSTRVFQQVDRSRPSYVLGRGRRGSARAPMAGLVRIRGEPPGGRPVRRVPVTQVVQLHRLLDVLEAVQILER